MSLIECPTCKRRYETHNSCDIGAEIVCNCGDQFDVQEENVVDKFQEGRDSVEPILK